MDLSVIGKYNAKKFYKEHNEKTGYMNVWNTIMKPRVGLSFISFQLRYTLSHPSHIFLSL